MKNALISPNEQVYKYDGTLLGVRVAEENGWGSCGTAVGKVRANQLANGENISRDTIARMAAFERHRQNSQKELGDGCGRLMWLCWGGDAGIEWAQRKLKQIDKEKLSEFSAVVVLDSSNVDRVKYFEDKKELVIKFNDGSYYTYFDIEQGTFEQIIEGDAVCKTSGTSEFGSWTEGEGPSVGAAVWQYLIDKNVRYQKGGSLR